MKNLSLHLTSSKRKWKKFLEKNEVYSYFPVEDIGDSFPTEPASAYSYFTKFIIDSLIEDVCEKTNMYYL